MISFFLKDPNSEPGQVILHNYDINSRTFVLYYMYKIPRTMSLHEQYYVMPALDLVGIIGGNLGVFIGFSFLDFIYTVTDNLKPLIIKLIGMKV